MTCMPPSAAMMRKIGAICGNDRDGSDVCLKREHNRGRCRERADKQKRTRSQRENANGGEC